MTRGLGGEEIDPSLFLMPLYIPAPIPSEEQREEARIVQLVANDVQPECWIQ